MEELYLLRDLKNIQGKNAKEEFIKKNKDNSKFMDCLYFLLNPMIITGISKAKVKKDVSDNGYTLLYHTPQEMFNYLNENNTGRDIDIKAMQCAIAFISNGDKEIEEILEGLITKSYKLGVTRNTVNKVVPKFIPHFSPMLAKSIDSVKDLNKTFGNGHDATLKLDGVRGVVRKENGCVTIRSREGREFIGITDIKENYLNSGLPDGVYDGELIAIRLPNEDTEDMFRRTITLVSSHAETDGLEHIVFEYLTLDEWDNENCELVYKKRDERLVNEIMPQNSSTKIKLVDKIYSMDSFNENTLDDLYSALYKVTRDGYEGIMLNPHDTKYIFKRGNSLFKAKEFDSADLLVIGINEGQGRLEGTLGTITVQYKDNFTVDVGSGFTDAERRKYFDNPNEIIGKIAEVQFQVESQDENGNLSLRFPTFKSVRFDKGINDIRYSDKQEEK